MKTFNDELLQIKANAASVKFFEHRGYTIKSANENSPAPIVAIDEESETLVFASVLVSKEGFASEETPREVMEQAAAEYLAAHAEELPENVTIRFDAVGVLVLSPERAMIRHHINCLGSM